MEKPPQTSGLRWLYIDFNSYFASVEQQVQPRLRGKPVAVVPVATDSTCAIAASYEAKAFGVRTGTPIYEARRMCPSLICVLARHELYVDFHHRILKEIDRHIPVTSVCSIDEAACWLMDNETSEVDATRIAQSIKQGLATRIGEYVRCSIGIAPNRYLAKVATDLQKPDGLTILRPGDLPQGLFTLALGDLPGIGRKMERRLRQAGIDDLPALWALDPSQMRAIWGSVWGERMWSLLRGQDLPEIETRRGSIGHSHILAPDLRDPRQAIYIARRLLLKAATRLRRMGYYARALSFTARMENGLRLQVRERFWRANDSAGLSRLLNVMWERTVGIRDPMRVKQISVLLHDLVPVAEVQPDLWEDQLNNNVLKRRKSEKISYAMDELNHRFGRDTILMGLLPSRVRSFTGPKIAFTRIPEREEFLE